MPDQEARPARAGLVPWRRDVAGRLLVGLARGDGPARLPSGQVDGRHPLSAALATAHPAARLGPPGPRCEVGGGAGVAGGWYWPVEVLAGHGTLDWRAPADVGGDEGPVASAATAGLPAAGRQVVLVRHARAGQRGAWDGPDAERPLDPRGRAQATALAALLPAYAVQRIHSADSRRCLETVGPLGAALGLPVQAEPLLSEDGSAEDPAGAERLVADLVARPGQAVLCTQRKTLSRVLPALLTWLGVEPDSVPVPRKGGLLVLHLTVEPAATVPVGAATVEALEPPR